MLLIVPPLHQFLVIEHAALATQADEVRGIADVCGDIFDDPDGGDDALVIPAGAVEDDCVPALEIALDRAADVHLPDRVAMGERLDEICWRLRP